MRPQIYILTSITFPTLLLSLPMQGATLTPPEPLDRGSATIVQKPSLADSGIPVAPPPLSPVAAPPKFCSPLLPRVKISPPELETTDRALVKIAAQFAAVGQYDRASSIVRTIEDNFSKAAALTAIAAQYTKVGRQDRAVENLSQALSIAQTIREDDLQSQVLADIAIEYAATGQYDQAQKIAQTIENNEDKADVLAGITRQYARSRQYSRALQFVQTIKNNSNRTEALAQVVRQSMEEGQVAQVAQNLSPAFDDCTKAGVVDVLKQQVSESIQAGKGSLAGKNLSQILVVAQSIQDSYLKGNALSDLAILYGKVGDFNQALSIAEGIENGSSKDRVLAAIASQYAAAGNNDQALRLVQKIENPYGKASALTEIASKYAEAGQASQASALLSQALEVVKLTQSSPTLIQPLTPPPLPRSESSPLPLSPSLDPIPRQ